MIFPLNLPHAQRLEVPGPLRPDSDVLDRQNMDPARRESSAMAGPAALTSNGNDRRGFIWFHAETFW